MRLYTFTLMICMLAVSFHAGAQCMPDSALNRHIIYTRDSSSLSVKDKIADLLSCLHNMDHCPNKNDSTHAFLYRQIGALYFREADYLKAVQYYQQSINLIVANAGSPAINPRDLINNYLGLSRMYDSLKNISAKMKDVDSCINIAIQLKSTSTIGCIRAFYARVEYLFDIGDYNRCVDAAVICEQLAWEYAKTGDASAFKSGEEIASSSLGWHINALLRIKNFDEAERILVNKVAEYKKAGLNNYLGLTYDQLAHVQIHRLNYEKAVAYFSMELKYLKAAGYAFNCKQTLNTIGLEIYFTHLHDNDKALDYYRQALKCVNNDKLLQREDAIESLNIFTNIANVYIQKGAYETAFSFFQLALDQIKPGMHETDILKTSSDELLSLKKIHYLSGLLIDKGDAFQKKYNVTRENDAIAAALKIYKMADQLLDRIKTAQSDTESKLFWRKDSRRLYEHAIAACYATGDINNAFYFFEKSRAVLLNDQLKEQPLLAESHIMKQIQVNKKILELQKALRQLAPASTIQTSIQAEIFAKRHELDEVEQAIKDHNPLYYQSFFDSSKIDLADVRQKILNDHQALVELFDGDSAVYAMIITATQNHITRIVKRNFDSLSNLYTHFISNASLMNQHFDAFVQTSHSLYQLIFKDFLPPQGRIIISPEGRYFPFESLVTNDNTRDPKYFLIDHSVSYTYSARYLLNRFTADSSSSVTGNLMGIAPVSYAAGLHLPSLSGSDLSLARIASLISGTRNRIAVQASRNNFLQEFPAYKIIQLYTHSSDSGENKEPVIYFADSALYLSDLTPGKQPQTQLIVLSACETGIGKLYQGEGIFSFNRGFAAIGIPSSIANLWAIDNVSTYQLTELFYKYVALGLPVDLALQKAKLEFIAGAGGQYRLPYYWAAAILVGKSKPVILNSPSNWKYLLISIAIASLALILWKVRLRKKYT